jgi:hypothetical protein
MVPRSFCRNPSPLAWPLAFPDNLTCVVHQDYHHPSEPESQKVFSARPWKVIVGEDDADRIISPDDVTPDDDG